MRIGLGMAAGTLLGGNSLVNEPVFFLGVGLGIATLFAARYVLSAAVPGSSCWHFRRNRNRIPFIDGLSPTAWSHGSPECLVRTMRIGGIHFLPMAITFGPRMLVLGLACITIASFALVVPSVPFVLIGVVDGVLKASIGGWMLTTKYPRRALNTTFP